LLLLGGRPTNYRSQNALTAPVETIEEACYRGLADAEQNAAKGVNRMGHGTRTGTFYERGVEPASLDGVQCLNLPASSAACEWGSQLFRRMTPEAGTIVAFNG